MILAQSKTATKMSSNPKDELENLLSQLKFDQRQREQLADPDSVNNLILDINECLSSPLSQVDWGACISLVLGKGGLVEFCKSIGKDAKFVDAKKSSLDLFDSLVQKDASFISKYVADLQGVAKYLYTVDKSAKVKCSALALFGTLLTCSVQHMSFEQPRVQQFVENLCLDIRGSRGSLLLCQQLRLLGIFASTIPEKLGTKHALIYKVIKEYLISQIKRNDFTAAFGAVQGLTYYLDNFPQGLDDTPEFYSELYPHLHSLLNPSLELPRRVVQRGIMDLLHKHGAKFSEDLWSRYDTIYSWLLTWSKSTNRDDYKAAIHAMDTFIVVIANMIELKGSDPEGQKRFKYFLVEYNRQLDTSSSSSQVSLAIKGYGLLAGACRLFLSPQDVHTMFNRVLTVSQQSFFQSSEMLENRLSSLPSYVESLGIIITKMDNISCSNADNLLRLVVALSENFPYVANSKRFLVHRALFTLFAALSENPHHYSQFLYDFVFQTILCTCSHPPMFDSEFKEESETAPEESSDSGWSGLSGKVFTYKSYLPLWKSLLSLEVSRSSKIPGKSSALILEISERIYCEFLNCVIKMVEKFDLSTAKASDLLNKDDQTAEEDASIPADPTSGIKVKVHKDFQIYMNLSSLLGELLPLHCKTLLPAYIPHQLLFFVRNSSLEPLVSTHYDVIATLLKAAEEADFFHSMSIQSNQSTATLVHLLKSYTSEVLQRCKQYRDQLLAACLGLIFQLPLCIIKEIFPQLVSPLKMSLQMGLSYLPIAQMCTSAIAKWSKSLPSDIIDKYFPEVLPMFLPYLRSQEYFEGEVHTRIISVKMSLANQKRKADMKKLKQAQKVDTSTMKKVQLSILNLLGHLDQSICVKIIPTDPSATSCQSFETATAWDIESHVKFSFPYQEVKLDVFLDELLPRTVDMALNSSNRQTKVVSCELLHSLIILMIGTGAQQSEATQAKYPMAPLYNHLFKAMLKLSCDADQVTRQLFLTLTYQVIHWFTNNRNFENPDTAVLLQNIMELLVAPNDHALRDLGGQCLKEFFIWSRKQARQKDQLLINTKSILKRVMSNCKHPSAFRRLGGCLAWNSIYQELREDEQSCNRWMLSMLDALLVCLELCEEDDPLIGTQTQCQAGIKHVQRILKTRSKLFNQPHSTRYIPTESFSNGTLKDLVLFLLPKIASPNALLRHSIMELLLELVPVAKDCVSLRFFIEKQSKCNEPNYLVHLIEKNVMETRSLECHDREAFSYYKMLSYYLKTLLAALDCYVWTISQSVFSAEGLFSSTTCIFEEVARFLNDYALSRAEEIIKDKMKVHLSLISHIDQLNELRCTIIVRLFDFIKVLVDDSKKSMDYLEKRILSLENFRQLVLRCALDPASLGFNLKDTEITNQLPTHMTAFLLLLIQKTSSEFKQKFSSSLSSFLERSCSLEAVLPASLQGRADVPLKSHHVIAGYRILVGSKWHSLLPQQASLLSNLVYQWFTGLFFSTGEDGSQLLRTIDAKHNKFIKECLCLAVDFHKESLPRLIRLLTCTEKVVDVDGKRCSKGRHILNSLGEETLEIICQDTSLCLQQAILLIENGNFYEALDFINLLFKFLVKKANLRSSYSSRLLKSFLSHWKVFENSAGSCVSKKEALVELVLLPGFLIDKEGVFLDYIKTLEFTSEDVSLLSFYKRFLLDPFVDLKAKDKALKLLPFFLRAERLSEPLVSETLQTFRIRHLPLRSTEFESGSARETEYQSIILDILVALELTGSPPLLEFVASFFCHEKSHRYESDLQEYLEKMMLNCQAAKQKKILEFILELFNKTSDQSVRLRIMEAILIPCLHHAGSVAVLHFFVGSVVAILDSVAIVVSGQAEEQIAQIVSKTGGFLLLQVLYSRLPKAKVFSPGAEVSSAFNPKDPTGKELTKEVFKRAVRTVKGELRHTDSNSELRRKCSCAAYNTLVATLSNVQEQLKFYTNFLFSESPKENIFESLIDLQKRFEFDIELSFNPSKKSRFVSVHQKNKGGRGGPLKKVRSGGSMAASYLADSSLRQDFGPYDFSSAVILSQNLPNNFEERMTAAEEEDVGMRSVNLDQFDFNDHEVMPNLMAVIAHMVDNRIMPIPQDTDNPPSSSDVPQWMEFLKSKLEKSQPRNVKLFILRLIINCESVFAPFANHFAMPMLQCVNDYIVGNNINYFVADILVVIHNWGKRGIPSFDSDKKILHSTLSFLIPNVPHVRADVFKYNVNLVKSIIELWRDSVEIPHEKILRLLEMRDGTKREMEAGIQVAGIFLSNGLKLFSSPEDAHYKTRFELLLLSFLTDKRSAISSSAAETVGLLLGLSGDDSLSDKVLQKLLPIPNDKCLSCLYFIQRNYAPIIKKFLNRILSWLPHLHGIHRERALQCLVSFSSRMEDVYFHLKEQNILESLSRKEAKTQLTCLQLVNAVLPRLTPPQVEYFLPGISAFTSHPSASCRELMYDTFIWIHDAYGEAEDDLVKMNLSNHARIRLLKGVQDDDSALRQLILNYWIEGGRGLPLPNKLLYILEKVYNPETEDCFLLLATHILLEAAHSTADFSRSIFPQPLTECVFREMKVEPGWQSRHASMMPLFADTQHESSSIAAFVSMTQSTMDMPEAHAERRGIQATQVMEQLFSATQDPSANLPKDTYNWMTGSSLDTTSADREFKAISSFQHSVSSGLLFTGDESSHFKPRLHKLRKTDEVDHKGRTKSKISEEQHMVRRRFFASQDREKQSIYFARQEEMRQKRRIQMEKDRKLRREAQVTMFRQYRVGELPDVQIPHKAVISPLQALAERDEGVASRLFYLLVQSILKESRTFFHRREEEQSWKTGVLTSLGRMLNESATGYNLVIRSVLCLALSNEIPLDAENLCNVCTGNSLETLGILALEYQQLSSSQKGPLSSKATLQPPQKRQRTEAGARAVDGYQDINLTRWLSIADLYKSLWMWDVVSGIFKSELGFLKEETRSALEAESLSNHFEAYKNYLAALQNQDYIQETSATEQSIWEEWYVAAAATLGQWDEVESFVAERILPGDSLLDAWTLAHPFAYVIPSLVNSKLMRILSGSDDGNLCQFIDDSRKDESRRILLESEVPLQLALLAINQEKFSESKYFVRAVQNSILSRIAQCSLLTTKPLIESLKVLQPLGELEDFLSLWVDNWSLFDSSKSQEILHRWTASSHGSPSCTIVDQLSASFRELYVHFIKRELSTTDSDTELVAKARIASQVALVKSSLASLNPHLAHRHLMKLETLSKGMPEENEFFFLKAEASIVRANQKAPGARLQHFVEAWCKHLGKVDKSLKMTSQPELEARYRSLESSLCLHIAKAIGNLEEWDPQNKYLLILASKFSLENAEERSSWYKALLDSGLSDLNTSIDLSKESEDSAKHEKACLALSAYCEECLDDWNDFVDCEEYSRSFLSSILKAMCHGCNDAHFKFPRLIHMLEKEPSMELLFKREAERVPTWMFLLWFSHILIYVDKAPGPSLHPIVERLATEYPQAVLYGFEVSRASYDFTTPSGIKARKLDEKVRDIFRKNSLLYDFVSAISLVRLPHIEIMDHLAKIRLSSQKSEMLEILEQVNGILNIRGNKRGLPSEYGASFTKHDSLLTKVKSELKSSFGADLKKATELSTKVIKEKVYGPYSLLREIKDNLRKVSRKLQDYSPWLANFKSSKHRQEIEIPGQYTGFAKPLPHYHTKISAFDENLNVMQSLRVPIRIKIYGSDENDYPFLIKAGEDLRTDQRMELLFSLMNGIYASSASCNRLSRRPSIRTYQVIPLPNQVGLLQWVGKTQPLFNFMQENLSTEENSTLEKVTRTLMQEKPYDFKEGFIKREDCIRNYEATIKMLPQDLIKRGLLKISSGPEGFFYLRNEFAYSYATLCISHWLLGIGDRHLTNVLLDLKTAQAVGIDFGHHFESATQFLPIPEVMPFRLTPQIWNVMLPLGYEGPIKETMIACLSSLKSHRRVMFSSVEAFVKEPTEDWLAFVLRQEGSSDDPAKVKAFSDEKLKYFRHKLEGFHPSYITCWALSKNAQVRNNKRYKDFEEAVLGKRATIRGALSQKNLTVSEQVNALIDQATDPNILGRTYVGWKPFL